MSFLALSPASLYSSGTCVSARRILGAARAENGLGLRYRMPSSVSPSRLTRSPSSASAAHHFALDAASFRSSQGQKLVGISHSQLFNGVVVQLRAPFLLRERFEIQASVLSTSYENHSATCKKLKMMKCIIGYCLILSACWPCIDGLCGSLGPRRPGEVHCTISPGDARVCELLSRPD